MARDEKLFSQFASERTNRLVYDDPVTGAEDAWYLDLLLGGLATFMFGNEIYEGTVDEMERKLFDLVMIMHDGEPQ